jgi:hypothetical protein
MRHKVLVYQTLSGKQVVLMGPYRFSGIDLKEGFALSICAEQKIIPRGLNWDKKPNPPPIYMRNSD